MKTEAELLEQLHEGLKQARDAAKQLAFARASQSYLQLSELLDKIERSAKMSAGLARMKEAS